MRYTLPDGPMRRFMERVNALVNEVAGECRVMHVEKACSLIEQEASFSIKVRFRDEVKPDLTVET